MKTNEFRLGNFLNIDGEIREVFALDDGGINGVTNPNDGLETSYPKNISYIPLTEEWLRKFGFAEMAIEKDNFGKFYSTYEIEKTSDSFSLDLYKDSNESVFDYEIGYGTQHIKIEYVHQLQNLYFALTGEELTIQ